MEIAYVLIDSSRPNYTLRIAQIVAINDIIRPDVQSHVYGHVTGIWPIEVQWLGGSHFRVLCLVGEDASRSPILSAHRDGNVVASERIYIQLAGRETCYDTMASCILPPSHVFYSACLTNDERRPAVSYHLERCYMAAVVVEQAVRELSHGAFSAFSAGAPSIFAGFWCLYEKGLLHSGDGMELRKSVELWSSRLKVNTYVLQMDPVSRPVIDTKTVEWPVPMSVEAASKDKTVLPGAFLDHMQDAKKRMVHRESNVDCKAKSETDNILSVSLKLDDMHNLWKASSGNPSAGGIWSGGPSPVERKYFGIIDASYSRPWGVTTSLFDDQPWRK